MNKTFTFIVVFSLFIGSLHTFFTERYVILFYNIFHVTIFYFIYLSIIIIRNTIIHKKNLLCTKKTDCPEFSSSSPKVPRGELFGILINIFKNLCEFLSWKHKTNTHSNLEPFSFKICKV